MTSVFSGVNATSSAPTTTDTSKIGKGMGALGATDFLKLLTTQMTMQDPTEPMDNKDMLARMAQFSSLSSTAEMNSTLKQIAIKLGAIEAPATDTETTTDTTDTAGADAPSGVTA